MIKLEYVILDLEWNGTYSKRRKKNINEIIEFGAVKLDENLNIIDDFSHLIKPQVGKRLNSIVGELTNISMDELNGSNNTFTHVYSKFKDFIKDSVILTWGNGDLRVLIENIEYYLKTSVIQNMDYYLDAQVYTQKLLDLSDGAKQLGLSAAAEMLSIGFEKESLHRALDDSLLTYECFKKLYNAKLVKSMVENVDDEFYKKLLFKNTILSNLNNPLIDKEKLKFKCGKCKRRAKQMSPWRLRNKSFQADFYCRSCDYKFVGRVQYKLKYEGVVVKQTSRPYKPNDNNNDKEQDNGINVAF